MFLIYISISSRISGHLTIGKYEGRIIQTSSMEPNMEAGGLIFYDKKSDVKNLKVGDVITFYHYEYGQTPITHRIVDYLKEGEITTGYICKGDCVQQTQNVHYSEILGKVTYYSKAWGNIILFTQKPATIVISTSVLVFAAVVLFFLPEGHKKEENTTEDKQKEIDELKKKIKELEKK
ncbi:MAG: signal peptidase I [Bacilli bacterium]|nr:signal peptidase I [Bacilli bacterium]